MKYITQFNSSIAPGWSRGRGGNALATFVFMQNKRLKRATCLAQLDWHRIVDNAQPIANTSYPSCPLPVQLVLVLPLPTAHVFVVAVVVIAERFDALDLCSMRHLNGRYESSAHPSRSAAHRIALHRTQYECTLSAADVILAFG